EREVLADRAVEQTRVAAEQADLAPRIGGVHMSEIEPIDQHFTRARLDQSGQTLEECRLARSVAPEHGHPLTRRDLQRVDRKDNRGLLVTVTELGLPHRELAARRRHADAAFPFRMVDGELHDAVEALRADAGLLQPARSEERRV